jgi:hypothetical protein
MSQNEESGLFTVLLGDGQPPLAFVAICLMLFGLFGLFLAARGEFLPHDVRYLGMEPHEL